MVHSDVSKAESWMRLTEEFLNSPLPNTDGTKVWHWRVSVVTAAQIPNRHLAHVSQAHTTTCSQWMFLFLQTDAHYSLLSLLLHLSGSPSNTDFTERPRVKEDGERMCLRHSCDSLKFFKALTSMCQLLSLSYIVSSEEEDNFDWPRYLMDGEDIDTGPYPDTPVSKSPWVKLE